VRSKADSHWRCIILFGVMEDTQGLELQSDCFDFGEKAVVYPNFGLAIYTYFARLSSSSWTGTCDEKALDERPPPRDHSRSCAPLPLPLPQSRGTRVWLPFSCIAFRPRQSQAIGVKSCPLNAVSFAFGERRRCRQRRKRHRRRILLDCAD
jgi:hypothetical protein